MFGSLKSKLLSAFAVAAFATALVGYFGLRAVAEVNTLLADTTKRVAPALGNVAKIRGVFFRALWETGRGIVATNSHQPDRVKAARVRRDQAFAEIDQATAEISRLELSSEEATAWQAALDRLRSYRGINDQIWSALEAGDAQRAAEIVEKQAPARDAFIEAANQAAEVEHQQLTKATSSGEQVDKSANALVWSVTALAVLAALALGIGITMAITRPLAQLKTAALRISEGDIDQRIEHRSADEIGALAESFRSLVDYIGSVAQVAAALGAGRLDSHVQPRSDADLLSKNMLTATQVLRSVLQDISVLIEAAHSGDLARRADASKYQGGYAELITGMNRVLAAVAEPLEETNRVLDRLASSDLTARAREDFQGEYRRMASSLNQAAENLKSSLLQVSATSTQVASASAQIAAASQSVAEGASEQAAALEQTSTALVQMSEATQRNAENARQANTLADGARQASSSGGAVIQEMSQAMSQIRGAAEGTAAIIRDINDIAFQTNLLALNAAVEAARAGEAGRGFAVVAEEVRNLALRSKESAQKTEQLIGQSVTLTRKGEELSERVSTTLSQIVVSVGRVSEVVAHIAHASLEQAEGIQQSRLALSQMDQATQQAAANSEETSSAADELAAQAKEMADLVGRFELGASARAGLKNTPLRAVPSPRPGPPALPRRARAV
jgi:methyl-accepting chemotaxis protein